MHAKLTQLLFTIWRYADTPFTHAPSPSFSYFALDSMYRGPFKRDRRGDRAWSSRSITKYSPPFPKRRKGKKESIKRAVQRVINETAETKCTYTQVNERTLILGGTLEFTNLTRLGRGTAPDERIGMTVMPKQICVKGWLRPRYSDEFDVTNPNDYFVRMALLRQADQAAYSSEASGVPAPLNLSANGKVLVGNGNVPIPLQNDFSDIMRPFNKDYIRPANSSCDMVRYCPNVAGAAQPMGNVIPFEFKHNFRLGERLSYPSNSLSDPQNGIFHLLFMNRMANDDTPTGLPSEMEIEVCAEVQFLYQDV